MPDDIRVGSELVTNKGYLRITARPPVNAHHFDVRSLFSLIHVIWKWLTCPMLPALQILSGKLVPFIATNPSITMLWRDAVRLDYRFIYSIVNECNANFVSRINLRKVRVSICIML